MVWHHGPILPCRQTVGKRFLFHLSSFPVVVNTSLSRFTTPAWTNCNFKESIVFLNKTLLKTTNTMQKSRENLFPMTTSIPELHVKETLRPASLLEGTTCFGSQKISHHHLSKQKEIQSQKDTSSMETASGQPVVMVQSSPLP